MPDDIAPLTPLPADLAEALERLRGTFGGELPRVVCFPSVTSSSDVASRLADRGAADLTTVVAELQTAGRGRLGRTWYSPPGAGLYASIVLRPENVPGSFFPRPAENGVGSIFPDRGAFASLSDRQVPVSGKMLPTPFFGPLVTLTAGVALAEAVRACTHLPVDIKWPNDLVVGPRKLAGILAEASGAGRLQYVIVGFGINLRSAAYPPEIADRATSIEAELGRPVDRGALLAQCLSSMAAWNHALRAGKTDTILERWRGLAPSSRGATVEWAAPSGTARGVTDGIDQDGALLVRTDDGVERLIAGEIKWL